MFRFQLPLLLSQVDDMISIPLFLGQVDDMISITFDVKSG